MSVFWRKKAPKAWWKWHKIRPQENNKVVSSTKNRLDYLRMFYFFILNY
jgi:hypothetical protein